MINIKIPYGRGKLDLSITKEKLNGVLESKIATMSSSGNEQDIVREAMENPINAEKLSVHLKNSKSVLIISSDHTRPVPSKITMPIILEYARKENPSIEIKILISTGLHRSTTEAELREKFGDVIFENEKIFIHDAFKDKMSYKGLLPSGLELYVNAMVDEVDTVIAEGFIEPHLFAGFSGGRKSILPGIAGARSIKENHCSKLIGNEYSRTGNWKNNPLHIDMITAAKLSGMSYIVNVVIDGEKKVVKAFAGDAIDAHWAGCEFIGQYCRVKAIKSDIVITSNGGYPLDQNIYQSIKSMTAAEASVNDNGVIICASKCNDGTGGDGMYKCFVNAKGDVKSIMDNIMKTEAKDTSMDQWMIQIFARIMMKARVILVADISAKSIITEMGILYAESLDNAIEIAYQYLSNANGITVIPDGISVIVE